jgi:ABC-type uncharacterized transport system permease subunit
MWMSVFLVLVEAVVVGAVAALVAAGVAVEAVVVGVAVALVAAGVAVASVVAGVAVEAVEAVVSSGITMTTTASSKYNRYDKALLPSVMKCTSVWLTRRRLFHLFNQFGTISPHKIGLKPVCVDKSVE